MWTDFLCDCHEMAPPWKGERELMLLFAISPVWMQKGGSRILTKKKGTHTQKKRVAHHVEKNFPTFSHLKKKHATFKSRRLLCCRSAHARKEVALTEKERRGEEEQLLQTRRRRRGAPAPGGAEEEEEEERRRRPAERGVSAQQKKKKKGERGGRSRRPQELERERGKREEEKKTKRERERGTGAARARPRAPRPPPRPASTPHSRRWWTPTKRPRNKEGEGGRGIDRYRLTRPAPPRPLLRHGVHRLVRVLFQGPDRPRRLRRRLQGQDQGGED